MTALNESFELETEAGDLAPFWIRHSQGDQWDFMLIYPMDDFPVYFSSDRVEQRTIVWDTDRGMALANKISASTSYKEE